MTDQPAPTPDELEHLADTVVGTVTLRAADLGLQRDFYERAIGLEARNEGPTTSSSPTRTAAC